MVFAPIKHAAGNYCIATKKSYNKANPFRYPLKAKQICKEYSRLYAADWS